MVSRQDENSMRREILEKKCYCKTHGNTALWAGCRWHAFRTMSWTRLKATGNGMASTSNQKGKARSTKAVQSTSNLLKSVQQTGMMLPSKMVACHLLAIHPADGRLVLFRRPCRCEGTRSSTPPRETRKSSPGNPF